MIPQRKEEALRWRKSTRSGNSGGECVELAHTRDMLRDSKNPSGPVLRFERARLAAFLDGVRTGRFDG
ncbi:DUF397 domain-containing protein [Saccharothrix coeruleofusca]|uniref:DUF397 domain-containing protein n=1 Tax=Saccharothrix coeruleofusca TaxID=33919 RepID=A0A918EC32_9PSEU|nr:DUF397 domain-containing protein [Saccharothrix coeruleofusca]MBP2338812.1 hypothetical protein [Saccharothrix coeruleofusca]GGP45771.1 hypothetical protein GCM10010185_16720 [Saccharothrix coeruleofusca]